MSTVIDRLSNGGDMTRPVMGAAAPAELSHTLTPKGPTRMRLQEINMSMRLSTAVPTQGGLWAPLTCTRHRQRQH